MRGDKYQYKEQITVSTVIINLRDQQTQEEQVLLEKQPHFLYLTITPKQNINKKKEASLVLKPRLSHRI